MYRLLLYSCLVAAVFAAGRAMAQATLPATASLVGSAAGGAIANRDAANDLYHRAWDHDHEAHHHPTAAGSPDPGLMKEAAQEFRQAMAADNQAQEMARSALDGLNSASQQEVTQGSTGSTVNVPLLEQIAGEQSPYAQEVADALSADGVDVGSLPAALPVQAAGSPTSTKAALDSRSPAGLGNGTQMAAGQPQIGAFVGEAANAALKASGASDPALGEQGAGKLNLAGGITTAAATKAIAAGQDSVLKGRKTLRNNLAAVRRQMGLSDEKDRVEGAEEPILAKTEDIFHVVHQHYQALCENGIFYEEHLPVEGASLQSVVQNENEKLQHNRDVVVKQMHPAPLPAPVVKPSPIPFALAPVRSFPE